MDEINMPEGYEEVKPALEMWDPVVGESVRGVLMEVRKGDYGKQWIISVSEDLKVLTPSHKVLQTRLENCSIGDVLLITLMKEVPPTKTGFSPTKMYKVYRKK